MSDDDLDKLIENLKSDDEDVRSSAAEALGKIGDARAVGPLIQVMKDAGGGDDDGLQRGIPAPSLAASVAAVAVIALRRRR